MLKFIMEFFMFIGNKTMSTFRKIGYTLMFGFAMFCILMTTLIIIMVQLLVRL